MVLLLPAHDRALSHRMSEAGITDMLGNLSYRSMLEMVGDFLSGNETRRVTKPLGTNDRAVGENDVLPSSRTTIDVILFTLPGKVYLVHLYPHEPTVLPFLSRILTDPPLTGMTCGICLTTAAMTSAT